MYIKRSPPLMFYWELSTNTFARKKYYDMTIVKGHSKRASLRKEGREG